MKTSKTWQIPVSALGAALLSLGLAGGAAAQSPASAPMASASPSATASSKLSSGDRKFMEQAAAGGMAEVDLSQLAQQKAESGPVKEFAGRMVQDHGKANDELKQLASGKGLTLPSGPDRKHMKAHEKLDKLSGTAFDREYMKHMLDDHKKTVSLFRSHAKSAKDADVKAFAGKTLPTLEEHLKMAQGLQRAGKEPGAARKASGT